MDIIIMNHTLNFGVSRGNLAESSCLEDLTAPSKFTFCLTSLSGLAIAKFTPSDWNPEVKVLNGRNPRRVESVLFVELSDS